MIRDTVIRLLGGATRDEVETRDRTIARLRGVVISMNQRLMREMTRDDVDLKVEVEQPEEERRPK